PAPPSPAPVPRGFAGSDGLRGVSAGSREAKAAGIDEVDSRWLPSLADFLVPVKGAEGATHLLAPRKRGWPPTSTHLRRRLPPRSMPTFRPASGELDALRRCREWLEQLDRGELVVVNIRPETDSETEDVSFDRPVCFGCWPASSPTSTSWPVARR